MQSTVLVRGASGNFLRRHFSDGKKAVVESGRRFADHLAKHPGQLAAVSAAGIILPIVGGIYAGNKLGKYINDRKTPAQKAKELATAKAFGKRFGIKESEFAYNQPINTMILTPEQARAELSTPPQSDTEAQLDAIYAKFRADSREVTDAEAAQRIDPNVGDEVLYNLLAEAVEDFSEVLNLDLETVDENIDEIVETGSPVSTFGEGLIALIVSEAPSFEEGMSHIEDETGMDLDTLTDIANDRLMPTPDQAMAILDCFECCQSGSEDMQLMMSFIDGSYTPSMHEEESAEMSRHSSRLEAEFALVAQQQSVLIDRENERVRLANIDRQFQSISAKADRMLAEQYMTPAEHRELIPQIPAGKTADFAAYFSAYAENAGTTAEQELDRAAHTLAFLEKRGKQNFVLTADFSKYSQPEPLGSAEEAAIAAYRKENGYC
jgi:hypothetical protein